MTVFRLALFAGLLVAPSSAAEPGEFKLLVGPTQVSLSSASDRQSMVVQAIFPDASTRDVTRDAKFTLDKSVAMVKDGIVTPATDGSATLTVSYSGQTLAVPITVSDSAKSDTLRFRLDVMPIFTKVGCNTGKCHGSASGKDGFRLSLFGYDPEGDYFRITREQGGRRINLADPGDGLLLAKATGTVPHTGGARLPADSKAYKILRSWVETGAHRDPADTPKPVGVDVFPAEVVFAAKGDSQRVVVRARYSDGSDRDVTDRTVFLSNNDGVATATDDGRLAGTGPGDAFVLARFDELSTGVRVTVRPGSPFSPIAAKPLNYVDEHVHAKLTKMHVRPGEVCSDEVFLRRVFIDLIGLLPSPGERETFLADTAPDKREKLVDALIAREEFLDIWVMKWAEILQIRTVNGLSPKGLQVYDQWLRKRVRDGATIDRIVRDILPASGGTFENPAANYYQTETTPQQIAENVAQVFLGTRIQCAQCHNHPFDRWTMDDYYGFAAFFGRVGYKAGADPRELTVYDAGIGEIKHPVAGRTVVAKFLGGNAPSIKPSQDYRAVVADWLTGPDNPVFARTIANVVWAHFFEKGIVDPVDDIRVSNPPSNPALLDAIGENLARYKYDVRKLVRDICLSRTYQLETTTNPTNEWDTRNFSHQTVRRMRAEVLLDAITQVTGTTTRLPGVPAGGRAVHMPDGRSPNYFLTTFGRSTRATACSCEVNTTPTLSQALHLLNGDTTSGKVTDGKVVTKLLAAGSEPSVVAVELYVRCLGRRPTAAEAERIASKLDRSPDKTQALEDLFWALLNANEFVFVR